MNPTTIVWLSIVAIVGLMFAGEITAAINKVLAKVYPAAATSSTATTITGIADTASRYAQYAAGRAAVYELRIVDFTNGTLDIHAELDAIDAKLAAAVKAAVQAEASAAK